MSDKYTREQLSKVTQIMIDTVADVWELQNKNQDTIDLTPETCNGMSQADIDLTIEWLYSSH